MYADNTIITASRLILLSMLWGRTFLVKDLGQLSYFLSFEVDLTKASFLLSQRKYIHNLLLKNKMILAKATSMKFSKFDSFNFEDENLYRSIVRGLQYLSLTRSDIFFAINKIF